MPVTRRHALLVSYKAASDLLGKAAFFAVLVVAARTLPTAAFGAFSLASTLGWLLSVATDFGLQLHAAREIAGARDAVWTVLPPIFRLRFALTAAATLVALAGAYAYVDPADRLSFVAVVCAYLLSALVEFVNYVYRAVDRSDLESTLNLAQRGATLALAFALLTIRPSLASLAVAMAVPPAVTFAVSLALLSRAAPRDLATPAARAISTATFFRDVFPIGAGIVLSSLYFRIDVFLLEHWRGIGAVASYNAVFRLVEALRLFPAAVLAVLLPAVFGKPTGGFVLRLSAGLTAAAAVMTAILFPFAALIIDVTYGSRFREATTAFRILLVAFPFLALNYGLTHVVIGWRGQRAFAIGCAAGLVANIWMNAWLIPTWGASGAAASTLLTELLLTLAWTTVLARHRPRPAFPASA